jgi:hypothetical protein
VPLLLEELQGCVGDVPPAAVEDQGVAAAGDLLEAGDGVVALLLAVGGAGDRGRAMWSRSPVMSSIGPRPGFLVSALTWVKGLMLAVAAWNSGIPEPGTG